MSGSGSGSVLSQLFRVSSKLFPIASQSLENTNDSSSIETGLNMDDSESDQSVNLGDLAYYKRFYLLHVMALLPTAIFLTACIAATWKIRSLCRISTTSFTLVSDYGESCRILLDNQLMFTCFLLGAITWMAYYACRRASWYFSSSTISQCFPSSRSTRSGFPTADRVIVFTAITLQSLSSEGLHLLSFYLVGCVLVAARTMKSIPLQTIPLDGQSDLPRWAWRLSFRDPRFCCALWASLAWATCEFTFGSIQILHQVGLYRPIQSEALLENAPEGFRYDDQRSLAVSSFRPEMIPEESDDEENERTLLTQRPSVAIKGNTISNYGALHDSHVQRRAHPINLGHSDPISESDNITDTDDQSDFSRDLELEQRLEDQVEELLLSKERAELESVLGVPLPEIPIALCMLWRIDAMLWCLGSGLLLSACFAHAQGEISTSHGTNLIHVSALELMPPISGYIYTFTALVILHTAVSTLWSTSLPTFGFASATYGSLLLGIALLVAGLARWGLLA